jgi:hypothetical protein
MIQRQILLLSLIVQICCQASLCAQDLESHNNTSGDAQWKTNVTLSPSYCQGVVNNFSSLASWLDVPEHLEKEDAMKTDQDFNVNQFFTVLDRLSMESGYVLDYVYYFGGIGGEPVLYARKANQLSYKNYSEFNKERKIDSPLSEDEYMNHIQAAGTPEGFFQLYVMRIMGGQFYLFWHALYDDYRIACNSSDAALYLLHSRSEAGSSQDPSIQDIWTKARQIDFTPVVEMNNTSVRVNAVVFTDWGGFIRRSTTFKKEFPHEILKEDSQVLVPYDCGIVF